METQSENQQAPLTMGLAQRVKLTIQTISGLAGLAALAIAYSLRDRQARPAERHIEAQPEFELPLRPELSIARDPAARQ